MKISKVRIIGYKSIIDQEVKLNNINILIGGNGIGKTNFISAFELLRDLCDKNLQRHVLEHGGASSLLYLGRKKTDSLFLELEFDNNGNKNRYSVDLHEANDELFISKTYTSFLSGTTWHKQICDQDVKESSISSDRTGQAYYVGPMLNTFDIYHFHDTGAKSPIKGLKNIDDNRRLKRDGSNIAPFLFYLKTHHQNNYKLIERIVASVTPFFRGFYLEPNRLQPDKIRLEWLHTESLDSTFNDWQFSDGTLRFICLTTLLLQPDPPSVILIDEPELGLHPQAINKLSSLIRKTSKISQLIISTQSVCLIDNFEPEDIIVVDKKNASSEYRRLISTDLEQWKNEYSLGEMWEMNIIGGQPL